MPQLILKLDGSDYGLHKLPGRTAWRVTPRHGRAYDVARDAGTGSIACTCPDFKYRHSALGALCKHGRALAELGLLALEDTPDTTDTTGDDDGSH